MRFGIVPPKLLESSKNSHIKGSDILWSIFAGTKILEKVVKRKISKSYDQRKWPRS